MEMPEGLKIAYDCDTSTDGGRERIDYALNLMQELVEALEIEQASRYHHPVNIDTVLGIKLMTTKTDEVLQKFKEWK